jgi:hypothetical protein
MRKEVGEPGKAKVQNFMHVVMCVLLIQKSVLHFAATLLNLQPFFILGVLSRILCSV